MEFILPSNDYYYSKFGDSFEKSYDKWIAKYCEFDENDDRYSYNMDLDEFYNNKFDDRKIPFITILNFDNIMGNIKLSNLDAYNV